MLSSITILLTVLFCMTNKHVKAFELSFDIGFPCVTKTIIFYCQHFNKSLFTNVGVMKTK